jgi:hypothetical protein
MLLSGRVAVAAKNAMLRIASSHGLSLVFEP